MSINLPTLLSQQDPKWKDVMLGFNTSLPFTIGNYGCVITSLAMVSSYFGNPEDPYSLNDKLKALGENVGFKKGTGSYVFGAITKLFPKISEKNTFTPNLLTDVQMTEIKQSIKNLMPVILQIDVNPRTSMPDSHFVVAVEWDDRDENNITIADPLTGKLHSLKDYLGWYKPSARKTIEQYLCYTGPITIPAADPLVCDRKSVRDMLVSKASAFDTICNQLKISQTNGTQAALEQVQHTLLSRGVL